MKVTITLTTLDSDGRRWVFRTPLKVRLKTWKRGGWVARWAGDWHPSFGDTVEETLADFAEDFADSWDQIALANDSKLHASALPLKQALLTAVERVVEIGGTL
jgi:hypothetical protein